MPRRDRTSASDRRTFLKVTGGAAVTAAVLPDAIAPAIHAADKSGSKPPVIGQGDHSYECHHDWGELPGHVRWETTHGVAVDAAGLVYIKHQGLGREPMDTIVVFDPAASSSARSARRCTPAATASTSARKAARSSSTCATARTATSSRRTSRASDVWTQSCPKEAGVYKNVQGFQPTNVAFAPDGGFYVGRRLRLALHPPVRQGRQVGPHLGRAGQGSRQDANAARHLARRPPRPRAAARRRRPGQRPAAVLLARRQARSTSSRTCSSPPTSTSAATCCWCPTCTPA